MIEKSQDSNKQIINGLNVINVPLAVIIASFIVIIITTNMTDTNGLSALLGGYYGLFLGMFCTMLYFLLYDKSIVFLDMFPILMITIVVSLLIYYLTSNFERISKGEVSGYYLSFSILSTIFLAIQTVLIFNAIYGRNQEKSGKLFSDITFSLLGLVSVINILIILTIGIILHFYSTQG